MTHQLPLQTLIALVQAAYRHEPHPSFRVSEEQWPQLYAWAVQAEVAGWLWPVVARLPVDEQPPRPVRLAWALSAERIGEKAKLQEQTVCRVMQQVEADGWRALLLKGQAVAACYPEPRQRLAGDIDLWIEGDRKEVVRYARSTNPACRPVYHHVDTHIGGEEHVELHLAPSWMYGWRRNRRLQRWFEEQCSCQFAPSRTIRLADQAVAVPTIDFLQRYLLVHMYRHLFEEGLTLRRVVDYGYLLQQGMTAEECADFRCWTERMGLKRFTGGVMYLLEVWLGMEPASLPMSGDARSGEMLMAELLPLEERKINGKFDPSNRLLQRVSKAARTQYRNLKYLHHYPTEVLSAPLFKVGHYLWRKMHGWT